MSDDWRDFGGRYDEHISDYSAFKEALLRPFPICLRPNLRRISLNDFLFYLNENYPQSEATLPYSSLPIVEVKGERSFWGGRLEHHQGLFFMQALSSLIPVRALDLKPDDVVLDLCAAPGGKTTDISSFLTGDGYVVANEPSVGRGRVLKANTDRMSCENVIFMSEWGEKLSLDNHSFDKILLDGPCSSEGTIRQSTQKNRYTIYNVSFREKLQNTQRLLMDRSYHLLKSGGTLVYSTCTYDPDENEKQVIFFLDKYQDMELVSFDSELPLRDGLFGLTKSKRVYPHDTDTIGFYVAKFIKH